MATRTPPADGLTVAPSDLSELDSHRYWGRYAAAADLPNAASNAASSPSYDALQPGDVAFVTGLGELYVCTAKGTSGGADATWVSLSGGGGTTTPRSSHVLVVAEEAYLQPLAAVASPPMPSNNANLDPAVGAGDVVGTTCDYLDPGDGTEIEQALLAAASVSTGIDIRLRPMNIAFDPSAITSLPLVIPDDCHLIGAGREATTLTGGNADGATTQQMFAMGERSSIQSMSLISPAPFGVPPANAVFGVISNDTGSTGEDWVVRDCNLQITFSASDRVERAMIHDQTGTARVFDCDFVGGNGWAQTSSGEAVAIFYGQINFSIAALPTEPGQVRNCRSSGFNTLVAIENVTRPIIVDGWHARDVYAPFGAFRCRADYTVNQIFRGPYWSNLHVDVNNFFFGAPNSERAAFFIDVDRSATIEDFHVASCGANFANQGTPQPTYGVWLRSDATLQFGSVRGVNVTSIFGSVTIGAHLDVAAGASGTRAINSVRMSEVNVEAPTTNGGVGGRGAYFNASGGLGSINECSILNSDLSGAQVAGVEITALVNNTQVGWDVLTPGAGVAIIDAGVGTIQANNVP